MFLLSDKYSGYTYFFVLTDTESELTQYGTIKKGDFVAVFVEHHWTGKPQIGKVQEIDFEEGTLLLHWFSASWTGKCGPLWYGVGSNRKPKDESIDIRCVVLWQFELTRSSCLKHNTVSRLKNAYAVCVEQAGMK